MYSIEFLGFPVWSRQALAPYTCPERTMGCKSTIVNRHTTLLMLVRTELGRYPTFSRQEGSGQCWEYAARPRPVAPAFLAQVGVEPIATQKKYDHRFHARIKGVVDTACCFSRYPMLRKQAVVYEVLKSMQLEMNRTSNSYAFQFLFPRLYCGLPRPHFGRSERYVRSVLLSFPS